MGRSTCRARVVGAGIGLLAFLAAGPAWCQGQDPGGRPSDGRPDNRPGNWTPSAPGLSLPTDVASIRRLRAANDYAREQAWYEIAHVLQILFDASEDTLLPVHHSGSDRKDAVSWTGVRTEATRLLRGLPAPGRESYEKVNGPRARGLLIQAMQEGDSALLDEVARRYGHTTAGGEAARLLALHHLDRGRFDQAALCFTQLLDRTDAGRLLPATLFASALAFRLAGQESQSKQVWNRLVVHAPRGVPIGDRLVTLTELEEELDRIQRVERGARGVEREGSSALRDPRSMLREARWSRPTLHEAITREWLQAAVRQQQDQLEPALPACFPLASGDQVIYRSHRGIHAVERTTGKPVWELACRWGLDRMAVDRRFQSLLASWVDGYLVNNAPMVFGNATLGSLSTDGARVYAVEDLPFPPYPFRYHSSARWRDVIEPDYGPELNEAARCNQLVALEAESGRQAWRIGGPGEKQGGELHDSYFLGPPLPLGGRLYGLVEKKQELYLACLDAARGTVLWSQVLAAPSYSVRSDVERRVQGVQLAYGQGVLVCPTNAGVVLGVDLLQRSLLWAHIYREESKGPDPNRLDWGRWGRSGLMPLSRVHEEWKPAAPVVHAGKVVFTAPDASSLHCLNLRDGKLLWKAGRAEDDLYLGAVHADKVIVVGKQSCRALRLADGKQLWAVGTGVPSGRGTAGGGIYYLPLRAAPPDKRPAVWAIDLEKGAVLTRTPTPPGEAPGNLVLCGDSVLSQTITAVTAYPPRRADEGKGK